MVTTGIKELKNQLSRYLSMVRDGEEVLVTDRGKAIARIICEQTRRQSIKMALHPLAQERVLSLPTQEIDRNIPHPVRLGDKSVSETAVEDQR
ncbi:MAG: type II toxin-antitoxin system prevent-host-death family antitoxin [Deltaproteobacteria bacterium]|nr:type II toxin-antitoxin system prevent-host-death family antitoxin [Deltaproteobacteria bacterium]